MDSTFSQYDCDDIVLLRLDSLKHIMENPGTEEQTSFHGRPLFLFHLLTSGWWWWRHRETFVFVEWVTKSGPIDNLMHDVMSGVMILFCWEMFKRLSMQNIRNGRHSFTFGRSNTDLETTTLKNNIKNSQVNEEWRREKTKDRCLSSSSGFCNHLSLYLKKTTAEIRPNLTPQTFTTPLGSRSV